MTGERPMFVVLKFRTGSLDVKMYPTNGSKTSMELYTQGNLGMAE